MVHTKWLAVERYLFCLASLLSLKFSVVKKVLTQVCFELMPSLLSSPHRNLELVIKTFRDRFKRKRSHIDTRSTVSLPFCGMFTIPCLKLCVAKIATAKLLAKAVCVNQSEIITSPEAVVVGFWLIKPELIKCISSKTRRKDMQYNTIQYPC